MKIKVTDFGARHFDHKFGGTKVLNKTVEEFEAHVNDLSLVMLGGFDEIDRVNELIRDSNSRKKFIKQFESRDVNCITGYADFCKLVAIPNFTNAKVGSLPITLENYQYIRSGYSARKDGELPVFSRWVELPVGKPRADYLVLVLYSKEQLEKEAILNGDVESVPDCDYGIVAILGQSHNEEEPMKPETMLRNALGIQEGGSGVALNKKAYNRSVEFWDKHVTVK